MNDPLLEAQAKTPPRCACCNQPITDVSESIHLDNINKAVCFLCVARLNDLRVRWQNSGASHKHRNQPHVLPVKENPDAQADV